MGKVKPTDILTLMIKEVKWQKGIPNHTCHSLNYEKFNFIRGDYTKMYPRNHKE